jgi:hypothetical protein
MHRLALLSGCELEVLHLMAQWAWRLVHAVGTKPA